MPREALRVNSIRRIPPFAGFLARFLALACAVIFAAHCASWRKTAPVGDLPEAKHRAALRVVGENPALRSGALTLRSVENLQDVPRGRWASGSWGAALLANERLLCVIAHPEAPAGQPDRPGALVDFTRAETGRDTLGALLPNHGVGMNNNMRLLEVTLKAGGNPNEAAAVVIRQESKVINGLQALTEFLLEPGAAELTIRTTWKNLGADRVENLPVGDMVYWGDATPLAPGVGVLQAGKDLTGETEFLAALTASDTFALASKKGRLTVHASGIYITAIYDTLALAPGATATIERRLFAGGRDMAAVGERVYQYQGIPYGWIIGRVVEVDYTEDKRLVDRGPVPGAEVRTISGKREGRVVSPMPYVRSYTNDLGEYSIPLPVGTWHLETYATGHVTPDWVTGVDVNPGASTPRDLTLGPASYVAVHVVDSRTKSPIPCKMTFQNMLNTRPVDFGPPTGLQGANVIYSRSGQETVKVPAGDYRVLISRGIEYTAVENILRVQPMKTVPLEAELERVVPTQGWISVDVGVQTNNSRGCQVRPEDRIAAAACEGVEYLITGDDLAATDLSEVIHQSGLASWLRTSVGRRIPRTGAHPLGEFLVFPLDRDAPEPPPDRGAVYPGDFFKSLRKLYPGALIAVTRPTAPEIGYYSIFGWTPQAPRISERLAFSTDYDLLQLWEGKRIASAGDGMKIFWMERGFQRAIAPYGSSNSEFMQTTETGYPRTYVAVPNDDPMQVTEEQIVRALREGRVVVTNGPFVDFKVQGQGPGSLVRAENGKVTIDMKVYAPSWINTYAFNIYQEDGLMRAVFQPGLVTDVLRYPREGDGQPETLTISVDRDCLLMGGCAGTRPMAPIVSAMTEGQETQMIPYAVTGPVFVDADGDGVFTPRAPKLLAPDELEETED